MKKLYEIRETKTNEVLVDNLSPKQAPDVFEVYQNYFGVGNVKIAHYEVADKPINISRTYENKAAEEYKNDLILYFEELQMMGNL